MPTDPAQQGEGSAEDRRALLQLLGLARRAGCLEIGATAVLRGLERERSGGVVLMAQDAGGNVVRRVLRAMEASSCEHAVFKTGALDELKSELGRDKLAVVAVFDAGFASGIRKRLASQG